jgi:hypothetical protein
MAFLFEINNKVVYPKPETLLIEPFNTIWNRDKSTNKEIAIQEMTYIEFITSMLKSNPYREYPEETKHEILKKDIIKNDKWIPDDLIYEGINKIKLLQTEGSITYGYWMANKNAIEKMIAFFNDFDMNAVNLKSGMPIYKPRDITGAVSDAEKTLTTVNNLKAKVDEEVFQITKNKSDKTISTFMQ